MACTHPTDAPIPPPPFLPEACRRHVRRGPHFLGEIFQGVLNVTERDAARSAKEGALDLRGYAFAVGDGVAADAVSLSP